MLKGFEARRLAAAGQSGKLASRAAPVHQGKMRRLAPFITLLVAGCASTPQPAPEASKPVTQVRESGDLLGLTVDDLVQRFGRPSFQVREGVGLKLQFAGSSCVLDAYLYRPESGSGVERVIHVDTRRPSGEDVPRAVCLAALAAH